MEEFIVDDSFTGETGDYDLTLIVDGHKIRVLKAVLCLTSPVFRAMLQTEFKEKDQAEVNFPEKNYHDFAEFLSCTYPGKLDPVTSDNVYRILPLVFEYQVRPVEEKCQKYLIYLVKTKHLTDTDEVCRHIQLSEMYNLEDLRKICISAASDFTLDALEKAASKYQVTENTILRIHQLARRKQELNEKDDAKLYRGGSWEDSSYQEFLSREIKINHKTDNRIKMRALRLWYRYCRQNEAELLRIKNTMKGTNLDDIKEEYELLPETIKQQLDADYNQI